MVVNQCDTVTYIKNIYLVSVPFPGTEVLKPLEFPVMRVIKVSFAMLMMWFLEGPLSDLGMGAGC